MLHFHIHVTECEISIFTFVFASLIPTCGRLSPYVMKLRHMSQIFAKSVIKTLLCVHSPFVFPPPPSTRASCVTAVIYMPTVEAEGVL